MTLIDNLTAVRSRGNALAARLGNPLYALVVLEDANGIQTVLEPQPKVKAIATDKIGKYLSENVMIVGYEQVISEIPRTYPEDLLLSSYYLINPVQDPDTLRYSGGELAEPLTLDRNQLTTWAVVVKPYRDR